MTPEEIKRAREICKADTPDVWWFAAAARTLLPKTLDYIQKLEKDIDFLVKEFREDPRPKRDSDYAKTQLIKMTELKSIHEKLSQKVILKFEGITVRLYDGHHLWMTMPDGEGTTIRKDEFMGMLCNFFKKSF